MKTLLKLGDLKKGMDAKVISVNSTSEELTRRILEMGILEGSSIRVVHLAPLGGDPIAVQVRGALIALRKQEAQAIAVELRSSRQEEEYSG